MNWRELVLEGAAKLEAAGIDDPALNAELLAGSVLGQWKRSDIFRALDQDTTADQEQQFEAMLARRVNREPVQYIIGETEFFGLRLKCTPSALIPRPETEHLVEEALAEVIRIGKKRPKILDIGTGTGAIALAIRSQIACDMLGVDVSRNAIQLAEENRASLMLSDVRFVEADILNDDLFEYGPFDLIVSNPPYVSEQEVDMLQPEIKDFEPRVALTDESDGFRFYKRIGDVASDLLTTEGRLILELGFGQSPIVDALMEERGVETVRIVKDLNGIDRVYVGRVRSKVSV